MTVAQTLSEYSALKPYLQMKTSLERFGKIASELESTEKEQLKTLVNQQLKLHQHVLKSEEATMVAITDAQVTHAIKELESRFASSEDFEVTLEANALDRRSITKALNLELHSETVLEYVSHDIPTFSEEQALAYYQSNLSKFEQPERRKTSHILITINDEFPENRREAAYPAHAGNFVQPVTGNLWLLRRAKFRVPHCDEPWRARPGRKKPAAQRVG